MLNTTKRHVSDLKNKLHNKHYGSVYYCQHKNKKHFNKPHNKQNINKMKQTFNLIIGFSLTFFYYILYVADNVITMFNPGPRPSLKTFANTPYFIGDAIIRVSIVFFVYLLLWLLI